MITPLTTEDFRRWLVGLADPARAPARSTLLREYGVRLAALLARLYNRDSLEPIKLWDRIDSALSAASAKVTDGDLDRYVSACLEHVLAHSGQAAASDELAALLEEFRARDQEWRQSLVAYIAQHRYPILVFARQAHRGERATGEAGGAGDVGAAGERRVGE